MASVNGLATALTERRARCLMVAARPLFLYGAIPERFDNVRFLELFHLAYTPLRYVCHPSRPDPVPVGRWMSDQQFEEVWIWWCDLNKQQRAWVITGHWPKADKAETPAGIIDNPGFHFDSSDVRDYGRRKIGRDQRGQFCRT